MSKLEVLCTSMMQENLEIVKKMNIRSDVVVANQCDRTDFIESVINGYKIRMISTETRGVGKNRNISLLYASGDILLFADDDMKYTDTYAVDIVKEFDEHPNADVMIFNIESNSEKRKQKQNSKTRRISKITRLPYGAPRIAIKKSSWEKSNVWFTTLFGGGAKYTSGEDSIFLQELKRAGLNIYLSRVTIGVVDMSQSSWFSGRNEEYFFNKGAFCASEHKKLIFLWKLYYCVRIKAPLPLLKKIKSFDLGVTGYKTGKSYRDMFLNKASTR